MPGHVQRLTALDVAEALRASATLASEGSMSGLPFSPSADRNRRPICQALARLLDKQAASVLEIGSGTGQHAIYFTEQMPCLHWQCTELAENLPALQARIALEGRKRLPDAIELDVRQTNWPSGPFDVVFTANTLHIMPWDHTAVLFRHAAATLLAGGRIIVYGPFQYGGQHTSASNAAFDHSLRQRDPAMGVRDAEEIALMAEKLGLHAEADLALPANNRILVFARSAGSS